MSSGGQVPYKILIFDDQRGKSSWGHLVSEQLKLVGFRVSHVVEWEEAKEALESSYSDIIVVDLDLDEPRDGEEFLSYLREHNYQQPIVLVTGNPTYLERPLREYANALASGAVLFYSKDSEIDFEVIIGQACNMVDPVRRSLSLMKEAGLGDKSISVNGEEYTISELLAMDPRTSSLIRKLKEALGTVLLEIQTREPSD